MTSINLNENETINVELGKQSSSLNTTLNDINYIPSYKEAETERRINEVNRMVNENNREEYINDLKERVSNGEFNGKDGAIQYKAGKGIEIKNEIISTTGESGGGTWGSITGTLSDQTDLKAALDNKAETSDIPTKVSDLNNDSEFITIAVNNLTNYYKKTEIYTQEEVNALISNINSFNVEVVQILPTKNIDTHTIYLVPKETETDDNYNEYIYINNSWEHIGSTNVDLTNYYNKTEIDTKLTDINEIIISETQPAPEDTKIWINTGEISPMHSEVVNSLSGNETAKAPSVQAVKEYIPKIIWEGELYGGNELTLSNTKRFLKCYVSIPFESAGVFVSGSFTLEINNSNENIKDMTGSIVLDESDSQNHTNYYVIAAKYNIDTKKIYVFKAGFFNSTNGAWNDRLSSRIYAIRRIETYD